MRKMIIAALALSLAACASASQPGAMLVEVTSDTIITESSPLYQAIDLGDVTGGKKTNPMWVSKVSSEDFAEALRLSFAAHTMLATDGGTYRLDAELQNLKQPIMGINMSVTGQVKYTLTEVETNNVVLEEVIRKKYTAKFGDALLGVERLRLANEGAIKTNISGVINLLIDQLGSSVDTSSSSVDMTS